MAKIDVACQFENAIGLTKTFSRTAALKNKKKEYSERRVMNIVLGAIICEERKTFRMLHN